MRLDQWLDIACLFKTRSEAQKACKGGKVDVNGQSAKPHREVHPGDEITISRPLGRKQRVVVVGLAEQHIPKSQARELYNDFTPPPHPRKSKCVAWLVWRDLSSGRPALGPQTSASAGR